MSKISLAPNASGTGTLTISAPNTNTDRAIALPDAAGTVFVSGQALSATTGSFSGTVSGGSTIGVGGATPSASGAGITFPATQSASSDANTLDDYEEGTWSPVFTGGGSNPTVTYTEQTGRYTKIGNIVRFTLSLQWSAFSGGSGVLMVSLPFSTSAVASYQGTTFLAYSSGITALVHGSGYVDPNTAYLFLRAAANNTALLGTGDVASFGHIIYGGIYQAA